MLNHANSLTCEEFQLHLAELIDSGADTGEVVRHPHAMACSRCRQLVEGLKTIAAAACSSYPEQERQANHPE